MRKTRLIPLYSLLWICLSGTTIVKCSSGGELTDIDDRFTATNRPPVARNGTLVTTSNSSVTGFLDAADADGDRLSFRIVSNPNQGSVQLENRHTGEFVYSSITPGSDSFAFVASDGELDSNVATVSISIATILIAARPR